MPTYEYACDSCSNNFEVVQKMAEAAIEVCPSCGKKVRRVLSGGIGISFKGSGFYVTDSAQAGKRSGSGGGNKASPGAAAPPAAASPAPAKAAAEK